MNICSYIHILVCLYVKYFCSERAFSKEDSAMRIMGFILPLLIFTILSASCQNSASYKADGWPGSSVYPLVRSYDDFLKREKSLAGPNVSITQAGVVTYDKVSYPIIGLSYTPKEKPIFRVFLSGGQHGNEPAAPEALLQFFRELSLNPALYKDVAIDAIPLVNPWGWAHNVRYEGAGYDTNRDFVSFVTGEAQAVRDFTKGKSYDLVIDHHEASRDGAFVYCYKDEDVDIADNLVKQLQKEGYAVASIGWNRFATSDSGVISVPGYGFSTLWFGRSVLPRYFTSATNASSFTMETSTYKVFNDRVAVHVDTIKFLIKALSGR
jgi:hypothetical protein